MGYGRLKKMVQGNDTLNKNQILPCRRWWHGPLFFLHQFLRLVVLLLLYHSGKTPSLIIIYSFLSIFCTSSSSSRCSSKTSWSSLEIFLLSSGGLEMEIVIIIPEESWSNIFLERICCYLFLTVSFKTFSSSCCNNVARIALFSMAGRNPSLIDGIIWDIGLCHWPRRWCAM